jgi:putative heme-binding domain-containing protein
LQAFLTDADAEIRAQAARLIGDVRFAPAADRVLPLLQDAEPRVRYFATEALGRLAARQGTGPIVAMLAANDGRDPWLQHGAAIALASIGDGAALEALASHPSRGVRSSAVVALRRMRHAGVARFLADADATIVTDAARAINDDGGIAASIPHLAALLTTAPVTNEPLVRRALNANLRLGTAEAVARIEAFARTTTVSSDLRVEAIATLGVWSAPSPMDRVDGYYHGDVTVAGNRAIATGPSGMVDGPRVMRAGVGQASTSPAPRQAAATGKGGESSRDAAAARAAIERLVGESATQGVTPDTDVLVALAEAAGRLDARGAAPTLQAQVSTAPSPAVRTASLRGLQAMKAGDMSALMQTALADKDATVRRAALALLPGLPLTPAAKASHLASLLTTGGVAEQQGALEVLGTLKSPESRAVLTASLDQLDAGRLAPALHIDLVDAVQADGSPTLQKRLDARQRTQKANALITAFAAGAVTGGDARKGQQVFNQHPLAECTRCHAIRGRGADVGPELTRVGSTLTREQLLEALVSPNTRIAPGFGTVGVTLKNGERVDGTLREETDTELVILTGTPVAPRRLAKAEIAERTDPVSAMPPLGLVLKPREVRDLIEFLSGLR